MGVFDNFKVLKNDMEKHGWVIEAFIFNYKNYKYIVLVKLYQNINTKPQYALLELEIFKENNMIDSLTVPVNTNGFMTDAKTLREFFNIEYAKNIGDILKQFNEYFSNFIPMKIELNKKINLKNIMISSLSKSDSQDPNKIYCFALKRNSDGKTRTPFNDNKSRLLRLSLYEKFKNDKTVSFSYTDKKEKEKTDKEIIMNFSNRLNV